MESFLGVPIHVHGTVYGNLYLAESSRGEFSADDEELMLALAMAAGASISNARLYQESQLQQRWLSASVEISSQLLAATGEDPLRLIARRAGEVADADLVTVSLVAPDGRSLLTEVALGDGADELVGRRWRLEETLSGKVVSTGTALLAVSPADARAAIDGVTDGAIDDDDAGYQHLLLDVGPVMILPLRGASSTRGVLSLVRHRGRRAFAAQELAMAGGFASHASVALELADSRAAESRVVLLEERDRIARDLHDHVIQELFAIGLSLESVAAALAPDDELGGRVRQRVEDIDRTIRRIRTSIFALRGPLDGGAGGLRQAILEITSDLTAALGFPPHVVFAGQVEGLGDAVADDVLAVVREAVTNVAKHAHASSVSVDVSVAGDEVVVTVTDDGVGIGDATRSSGTANLRSRAERRGGSFTLGPAASGGTIAIWKAALP